jgi:hypothetical protein
MDLIYGDVFVERLKVEQQERWLMLQEEIPYLEFPPGWRVRMVPPFAGAMVRFHVDAGHLGEGDERISVYLDWWQRLAFCTHPYWEAYPINGDAVRFTLHQTKELIDAIAGELERRQRLLSGEAFQTKPHQTE